MRNREVLYERAENMRFNPTFHEKAFQLKLESAGIRYKFQKVIGSYIVDFCIGRIIIEIDGRSHTEANQAAYDKDRTSYFKGLGFSVIRVKNEDVSSFNVATIINKLKHRPKTNRANKKNETNEVLVVQQKSQSEIKAILFRRKENKESENKDRLIEVKISDLVLSLPPYKEKEDASKKKKKKWGIKYSAHCRYK